MLNWMNRISMKRERQPQHHVRQTRAACASVLNSLLPGCPPCWSPSCVLEVVRLYFFVRTPLKYEGRGGGGGCEEEEEDDGCDGWEGCEGCGGTGGHSGDVAEGGMSDVPGGRFKPGGSTVPGCSVPS